MPSAFDLPPQILKVFLEEAAEALASVERALQQAPHSPQNVLEELMRTLQRLGRSAASIGLAELAVFCEEIREAWDLAGLHGPVAGAGPEGGGEPLHPLLPPLLPPLNDAMLALRAWIAAQASEGGSPAPALEPVRAALRKWMVEAQARPAPARPPSGRNLGAILIENQDATPEQIEKAIELQSRKLGELLIEQGFVAAEAVNRALEIQKAEQAKTGEVRKPEEPIRVPAGRIDGLLKLVGELSVQQSMVWHARQNGRLGEKPAQDAIALSQKIIKELQAQVMSLRLQPVRGLFQKLQRAARDAALALGKDVEVRTEGADVDFDKAVMEKIADSLIHIVRNAVDHGVETPAERVAAGKPAKAVVWIQAGQDAGDVILSVRDDGRGMDPQKILRKAIDRGFVKPGAEPRGRDVFNLIFLPGFSTSDQVTEFSGRGVGMNVVSQVAEELGGRVSIESTPGQGSTFSISLPTSVSLIDGVVFRVDGLRYVVPMRDLLEVLDLSEHRLEGHPQRGLMLSLRDEIVPVEALRRYLPRPPGTTPLTLSGLNPGRKPEKQSRPALLVRSEEGCIAFEVEEIVGQQPVVVRALSPNMEKIPGLVGGTILGDGEPGMIVGLGMIARNHFRRLRDT